jgi:hypothetical protein
MRHIEQLVPALLAASCWWLRVAHCAVAAPAAAAAPRIRDYGWSGTGCLSNSEVYLSAKPGKLMVQMPQFSVVAGDTDAFMMNCNLYLNMNGALAGYRLAIKSVSLEGYLLSRGQINTEMWTRVDWVGGPEPSKRVRHRVPIVLSMFILLLFFFIFFFVLLLIRVCPYHY